MQINLFYGSFTHIDHKSDNETTRCALLLFYKNSIKSLLNDPKKINLRQMYYTLLLYFFLQKKKRKRKSSKVTKSFFFLIFPYQILIIIDTRTIGIA
jgi:hypothetical protein